MLSGPEKHVTHQITELNFGTYDATENKRYSPAITTDSTAIHCHQKTSLQWTAFMWKNGAINWHERTDKSGEGSIHITCP